MSNGLNTAQIQLQGPEGRLVFIRVGVSPRALENVLEALAEASFPVNPEIRHGHPRSWVEFPAYEGSLEEVRRLLAGNGLSDAQVEVEAALDAIR